MTFENVIKDLQKIIGIKLESINTGHDITIESIDVDDGSIILRTHVGKRKSRPLRELEDIWSELCLEKPVHVDTALRGSGSSRNQPETILANLPYVEWLLIQNKKHLFYCVEETHAVGTLKQMDPIAIDNLKRKLQKVRDNKLKENLSQIIVVSEDLSVHASLFEHCSGATGIAVQQGVYEFITKQQRILLLSQSAAPEILKPGTYPVIFHSNPNGNAIQFDLFGHKYSLYQDLSVSLLFCI